MVLVGYWPLDENSGDAIDYAGPNNGTVNGATQGSSNRLLNNTSYDFDGTDDYVNTNLDSPFTDTSTFTISSWFYSSSLVRGGIVSSRQDVDDRFAFIRVDDGSNFEGFVSCGTSNANGGSVSVTANEWHHGCLVYNGNDIVDIYLDGELALSDSANAQSGDCTTGAWSIGRQGSSGGYQYYDGNIAEVRIYDHALTADEIQYLYEVSQHGNYVSNKKTL